jgi:hypothetical protein
MLTDNQMLNYINFIKKRKDLNYDTNFTITTIDVEVDVKINFGLNSNIFIVANNKNYKLTYSKHWSNYLVNSNKQQFNEEIVNLTGCEDIFLEHLMLLQLQLG